MANDFVTLICPACGKEIQIPGELEAFSCLYCGEKLRMADFRTPVNPADPADLAYVEAHLLDCIRLEQNAVKNFTRKLYPQAFQLHLAGIEDTWQAMDRYVCAQPLRREELIEQFVDLFLSQWEAYHNQAKKGKSAREKLEFQNKLTLAWYTLPAIRAMELSISEPFVERLQERFNAAYPENQFRAGTYTDLAGGFRKHGFCFVTTAICEAEGKSDDCPELMAFRSFRDGWLSETRQGRALIAEYYELAPAVVAAMRYGDEEAVRCKELRLDYLTPCYEAILRGDNEACRSKYQDMVRSLQSRYGLLSR